MFCQLLYFFIFGFILIKINEANVQEAKLMNSLFGRESQYNALITPVLNESGPLYVYFGLALTQIINVYEKEQIVKV
ncbi:unnamed protein product, partial [Rotaria magnacalcarata]